MDVTAAVPDPRFRDQLAAEMRRHWSTDRMVNRDGVLSSICGCGGEYASTLTEHQADALLSLVEARIQAAASQRAVEFHRAENAEERGEGICRTCLAPIWNEGGTVRHRKRAEGWSDRIERGGDSLVCFRAIGYRHVPLAGREAAIYDHAAALASPAPAPRAEEDICVHGHATDDAHVCGAPR